MFDINKHDTNKYDIKPHKTQTAYYNIYEDYDGLFTLGDCNDRETADREAEVFESDGMGKRVGRMRFELIKGQWDE